MRNSLTRIVVFLSVGFLLISLTGVIYGAEVSEEGKYGGTLTIATPKDVYNLDPGKSNELSSQAVYEQIFDTLVAFDAGLNIIPHVAESWESNDRADVWTFKIREGIKFHDGKSLTAEDVAYSFQRILDSPEAASQKRSKIEMIGNIETPDNYTVVFYLNKSYAPFPGAARQHIVPKHIAQEGDLTKNLVGSGPFKFVEWKRDEYVMLERNENYWLKRPYLEKVVFKPIPDGTVAAMSILVGEVDVVEEVLGQTIPQLNKAPGVSVKTAEGMNYFFIAFKQYGDPYNDVRFRKLVYYSTDMDQLIATIFENNTGVRAYTPAAPGIWPRDLEYMKSIAIKKDHEKAKELFEELIADGKMGRGTPIYMRVNEDPMRMKIGEVIITNLQELGVNAKLEVTEWSAYVEWLLKSGDPGIYIIGTTPAIVDPDAVFHWLFSTEAHQTGIIMGLKKHKADEWLDQARHSTNRQEREELYIKAARWAIEEEVLHIPAYHSNTVIAVRDRVHDLNPSPNNLWWLTTHFANVWVDNK